MAKAKQVTKIETKAVTGWADRVKAAAQKQVKASENMGGVSPWISFKGGVVQVNGAASPNGELNCVVIGYMQERAYYENDFDASKPQMPDCYGYGDDEGNAPVSPFDKARKPQSEMCTGCEWAEFGSADKGRGQACRQAIRIALVPATEEGVNGPLFFARIPPTSIKHARGWLQALGDTPCFAVMTEIKVTPSATTMFDVAMTPKAGIPTSFQAPILTKLQTVEKELRQPYPELEETAKPLPKAKSRGKF